MTEEIVYQSRVAYTGVLSNDHGRNLWADLDEAKQWLEEYVQIRFDAEPGDWRREQSADEKWSMRPDGIDARCVVDARPIRADAEEQLERVREVQKMVAGGSAKE
jgi:hypothetical protein